MPDIGVPELLILAVIVLLLFGPAKAADLGGALGKSIREFRRASSADDGDAPPLVSQSTQTASATAAPLPVDAAATGAAYCTSCGQARAREQRFCTNCGAQQAQ